jgi:hypothetical protein
MFFCLVLFHLNRIDWYPFDEQFGHVEEPIARAIINLVVVVGQQHDPLVGPTVAGGGGTGGQYRRT